MTHFSLCGSGDGSGSKAKFSFGQCCGPDPDVLGLLDPAPDPLVRGTDPASTQILLSSSKNSRKKLNSKVLF
jgi:hypothetical protein